ncbi:hypothetical protein IG631_09343 [Alternaria alternata]|nr:hypothetical protein IG631_09343 [Alternaria alternata]
MQVPVHGQGSLACGRSCLRPLHPSASLVDPDPANRDLPFQNHRLAQPIHTQAATSRYLLYAATPRILRLRYSGASAISVAPAGKPHWFLP